MTQRFLTTDEVAQLVKAPLETVRYWRHVGKGPKSFNVWRRVLYAIDDVEQRLAEAQAAADPRTPAA